MVQDSVNMILRAIKRCLVTAASEISLRRESVKDARPEITLISSLFENGSWKYCM